MQSSVSHKGNMCQLSVVDKLGSIIAEGVTPGTFAAFKKKQGKGSAVIVQLHSGDDIIVDSVKLMRRLPRDAMYQARLLRRVVKPTESLNADGHTVWVEV